jgi:hypothetical protein
MCGKKDYTKEDKINFIQFPKQDVKAADDALASNIDTGLDSGR